jgi:hypothetical protein
VAVGDRFPDPNHIEHLASVEFHRAGFVTEAERHRACAIERRRTDRLPLIAPDNWHLVEPAVRAVLGSAAVQLHVVPAALRGELAEASRLTESIRGQDSVYLAELDWWTAPFEFDEGIPRSALNSAAEADRVPFNRTFPTSTHGERRTAVRADQALVLGLSTPGDSRGDALTAGEALSTVLLECTAAGLATCTVSHVTESEPGRPVLAELIGRNGWPQVLIRVGRAPQLEYTPAPTPRRQLADVLRVRR